MQREVGNSGVGYPGKRRYNCSRMPAAEVRGASIRYALERILSSAGFARNERLSRFLRFVVEEELAGRGGEIKESLIALEVFGRKPNYNPKQDPVVRIEAGKLRARLAEYYASEAAPTRGS